jgi:hypothetical protein
LVTTGLQWKGQEPPPSNLDADSAAALVLPAGTAVMYELVSKGELAHVRVSNVIRVAPEDLDTFLKARRSCGRR